MPLHFLGLAGMPRRIFDYPEFYEGWNHVSTCGSMLTSFSLVVFIFVVVEMFYKGRKGRKAPFAETETLVLLVLTHLSKQDPSKVYEITFNGNRAIYGESRFLKLVADKESNSKYYQDYGCVAANHCSIYRFVSSHILSLSITCCSIPVVPSD